MYIHVLERLAQTLIMQRGEAISACYAWAMGGSVLLCCILAAVPLKAIFSHIRHIALC